jgi:BirA family transcriptional regulator, biotin operon repressor / biotin---[acetyl-CoA-carboxylase] ligase
MTVNISGSHTRSKLLDLLRNTGKPLSGEVIARMLGISRVAVWKQIQALNTLGYIVESSPSGYRLVTDNPDSLDPCEFGTDATRFRHLAETDSTMNQALEAALAGAESGYVVAADRQIAGRGTGSKQWDSPDGGLFFTIVTRPRMHPFHAHRQVLAAQCAMVSAIETVSGTKASVAWPNDILNTGKAGGILAETFSSGNEVKFLNLGIGVNLGSDPAGSLHSGTSTIHSSRTALLSAFLAAFPAIAHEGETGGDSLVHRWNSLCPQLGRTVAFRTDQNDSPVFHGTFRGTDRAGNALVDNSSFLPGSIHIIDKGMNT